MNLYLLGESISLREVNLYLLGESISLREVNLYFLGESISLREVKGHQSRPCSISHTSVSKGRGPERTTAGYQNDFLI